MILFVAVNTFSKKRTRDFIVEKREKHIRNQHVLKRHILKRHILKRHILKRHWEWFRAEHERLIWRRVTRRHIRLIILIWFRIASITQERHAIDQIVHVNRHFSHDFDQIVKFNVDFWNKFFDSKFHRFQQIDEMFADVFFYSWLHFFHQRCRSFRFVTRFSRFDNCASRSNQLQCLFYQIFESHFVLIVFI
jgi:hypothetical protein